MSQFTVQHSLIDANQTRLHQCVDLINENFPKTNKLRSRAKFMDNKTKAFVSSAYIKFIDREKFFFYSEESTCFWLRLSCRSLKRENIEFSLEKRRKFFFIFQHLQTIANSVRRQMREETVQVFPTIHRINCPNTCNENEVLFVMGLV